LQCEPELRDERGAAPARSETLWISHWVDAAAGRRVGIAGENEAIPLRQVGVVVAQIQIEDLAGQSHARIPIEIGGPPEAAYWSRLIPRPVLTNPARPP